MYRAYIESEKTNHFQSNLQIFVWLQQDSFHNTDFALDFNNSTFEGCDVHYVRRKRLDTFQRETTMS